MNTPLAVALIVASLLMAGWAALTAALDRRVGRAHLAGLAVVELLVIAQLVFGIARLVAGDRPPSTVTFLAYLVGGLFVVPVAALWSLAERSRPSTLVLTVGCLALPVMTGRLLQMWSAVDG